MENERMKRLLGKKQEIEREIGKIRARESSAKRKKDTRRKIVAGGIFLSLSESDPTIKDRLDEAIRTMPERDRKLFLPE